MDVGSQIVGLHIVPENTPETPEVPVSNVTTTSDSINVLEGATSAMPVKVEPTNATDRNVQWTVDDPAVAKIENGMVTGLKAGTTTATGELAGFTVEVTINVLQSSGELRGYVLQDLTTMAMGFWMSEMDYDLHSPGAADALYPSNYDVYAATYYNGKVYAYGENSQTDNTTEDGMHFFVFYAETGKVELDVTGYDYFTNLCDMTFDYTDGKLYAVAPLDRYVWTWPPTRTARSMLWTSTATCTPWTSAAARSPSSVTPVWTPTATSPWPSTSTPTACTGPTPTCTLTCGLASRTGIPLCTWWIPPMPLW